MIILDSGLVKTGTKSMNEMSKKMEKHMTALEKHHTLIQYYNETSGVKLKAIWCVNNTLCFLMNTLIISV
jgi:hypothetical protein